MSVSRRKSPPEAGQDETRRIKKYPNRRLYDTATSSYVTLVELKQFVIDGQPLLVTDAKSGEDITRSILLQIILEEESGGVPLFSEAALANLIRFYGHALQGFMGHYLEQNVQSFIELQNRMAEQGKAFTPESWTQFMSLHTPMMKDMLDNYVAQSRSVYLQMQEQLQRQTDQFMGAFGMKR
ncbi:MAG: polyhydroxyalkanoate synthesis repressor PhaR [Comamonas sp.]